MLQDIDDTGWILRPAVQPALAAMARHGLRFDALIKPRHFIFAPSFQQIAAAAQANFAEAAPSGADPGTQLLKSDPLGLA
jgi:hypothetical protein